MIKEADVEGNKWQFIPENLRLNPTQFQRHAETYTPELRSLIDSVARSYIHQDWNGIAVLEGQDQLAFVFTNSQKSDVLRLSRDTGSMTAAGHVRGEVRIGGRAGAGTGFEIPVIKDPMNRILAETD